MIIAVTYNNGEIFQHFGHSEHFKIYSIENGEIKNSQVVNTNGKGHGALAGFLAEQNADVLICGGIGAGAQKALSDSGIKLYGGVTGKADDAVKAFLNGSINFNPNVKCNHHHSDGEHHNCSSNGCGNHDCGK